MGHISDEEIEVQIPGCRERAVNGVGKKTVVLGDDAERPRLRKLVVPLGSNDVVVEGGVICRPVEDAIEDVGVIDLQVQSLLVGGCRFRRR